MVSKPDPHQLYSLTWSEFGSSLISSVQLFRGGNDLVDVTLAAGGRTFPAHKIVLSAASSFLRNILKSTPCKHPVVLLAGIASDDLESLLEFVYRGEVSVPPSQLQSLLQAAQCLSIQGLIPTTQADASSQKFEEEQMPGVASQSVTSAALARDVINSFLPIRRRKRAKRRDSAGSGSKHARTDSENDNGAQNMQAACSSDSPADGHKADDNDNDHNPEDQVTKSVSDQPATCPLCGAILRQSRNLRRHLELLHFGRQKPSKGPRKKTTDKLPAISPSLNEMQASLHASEVESPQSSLPAFPSLTNLVPMAASQISSHNLMAQTLALCQQAHRHEEGLCEIGCMLQPIPPTFDPMLRGVGVGYFTEVLVANRITDNIRQEVA